ncbi:MAG TPA: O-antigen ligase family protein [Nitrospirota bacterium]|nr:O-antigen ligase family protein [Nitrospirota bacterium]
MTSFERWQDKASRIIEKLLVISLSGLGITIFVGWKDVGPFKAFDLVSLAALLAWRCIVKYHPHNPIPRQVFIASLLFIALSAVSAFMSVDRHFAFVLLKQYRCIFLGGLLFTAPIGDRYRKYIISVFFLAAAVAGLIGISQYFGLMHMESVRPDGFSRNPNLYAGPLSIACSSAIVMLFLPKTVIMSRKGISFIMGVSILTLGGVILSQSRSIWVALFASCIITLFLHDRRKTLIFLFLSLMICAIFISGSNILRQRMISIVTSVYTEDVSGSTGTRIELWKGALLMFKERPFLGIGLGDFQPTINNLISENRLKQPTDTHHAHNIYLQVLATRGIIGIAVLLLFLISLIRWGVKLIKDHNAIGGYIIILITTLAMVGGLTDDHVDFDRFLTASCFTIGLIGPFGAMRKSENVIVQE